MIFLLACVADKTTDTANSDSALVEHLSWDVSTKGPYNVGYTTSLAAYTLLGEERETLINIWYPTEDTSGEEVRYFSITPDEEAFGEADWASPATEIGYPVLIFSHGSYLYGGSSSFLPRHFASHGWVVAAPDHTGHLLSDFGGAVEASTFYLRPNNMVAAIDTVASLSEVHTDSVILAGYSFGATDNWMNAGAVMNMESIQQMCEDGTLPSGCREEEKELFQVGFADARIKGIVPMAGADRFAWISTQGRSNLDLPVLMISGTLDDDFPQTIMDEVQGTDISDIRIEGGCHQLFSVGGCPDVPTEEGYSLVQTATLSFARDLLFGDQ